MNGRIVSIADAAQHAARERARGQRVVTTNGAFDLLHGGHRHLFRECRKLGDVLVVGVNSDSSVRAIKGARRPFQPERVRARRVARFADVVFLFDEHHPGEAVRAVRPDVHVTAETYRHDCPEEEAVRAVGAELVLVPVIDDFGSSTPRIRAARRRRIRAWSTLTLAASPVLLACGKWRRPRSRLLLVPLNGIGDAVQVTPLIRALKRSHPDLAVDVLARPERATLVAGDGLVDSFETLLERKGRLRVLFRLWRRRYSCVVVFPERAFLRTLGLWLCVPRRVAAWRTENAEPSLDRFNTDTVTFTRGTNRFDQLMRIAELLGADPVEYRLEFDPPADAYDAAERWLTERRLAAGRFVVVNPSAGDRAKEWPAGQWCELIRRMTDDLGRPVVVSTGSASAANDLLTRVDRPDAVFDASSLRLEEAGAISARAACFVAVDTGPLYVAHAAGAKVVVVAGCGDPNESIPPPGPRVAVVAPGADGSTAVDPVFDAVAAMAARAGRIG